MAKKPTLTRKDLDALDTALHYAIRDRQTAIDPLLRDKVSDAINRRYVKSFQALQAKIKMMLAWRK